MNLLIVAALGAPEYNLVHQILADLHNDGDLYRLMVESENLPGTLTELCKFCNDVRYVDSKEELGKKDKGVRRLADGSIIRRCQWFGSKIGAKMGFAANQYKLNTILKARSAEEVIACGC